MLLGLHLARRIMAVKTAVLMMNLGGPRSASEVTPFLVNMFSDTTFIPLPFGIGKYIAQVRSKKVNKQYASIGYSPLSQWTQKQGAGMVKLLDQISPETAPHKFYECYRYASPMTPECAAQIKADQPERVIVFTQFPQYSCATTGNGLREVMKHIDHPNMTAITRWATHPAYISSTAAQIKECLKGFQDPDKVPLVFTAHSLPVRNVLKGDVYPYEVGSTVQAVLRHFPKNRFYMSWQSQVSFNQWLEPQTKQTLLTLAQKGVKDAVLVPSVFTQEHLETLFELDHEYVPEAKAAGLTNLVRCPAPNDSPLFIHALATIVKEHIAGQFNPPISRCINCSYDSECSRLHSVKTQ